MVKQAPADAPPTPMPTPAAPEPASVPTLRGWLERLEASGRLARARPGIPLRFTLAALAKRLDGRQATFFPEPAAQGRRHRIPVVSGLVSARAWIAEALGTNEAGLLDRYRQAIERPLPC